jgi:hypothetical protein
MRNQSGLKPGGAGTLSTLSNRVRLQDMARQAVRENADRLTDERDGRRTARVGDFIPMPVPVAPFNDAWNVCGRVI